MRDPAGRNHKTAAEFVELSESTGVDLHVVDLDVASQKSANDAVRLVVETSGKLDVVTKTRDTSTSATSKLSPTTI